MTAPHHQTDFPPQEFEARRQQVFDAIGKHATAVVAGAWFLLLAWAVRQTPAGEATADNAAARRLFGFSILYLFALFAVLLAEHTVARLLGAGG